MEESAFDDVMAVNLKGTFLMTQAFGRAWTAEGSSLWRGNLNASVINISSMVGKMGNLGQANYAASKAGVIGFTKTAAKELARDSIRVNAILPGFIATPMTAAVPEKVLSRIIPTIPAGRMGQPLDIANAALFLASDRSLYMTGGALEVAGGLSM
jgi:17beta-estradiol 17-dehydrogenase/3alpha(17beta)-hydroxysteroid dehydrogenase (NAD+)